MQYVIKKDETRAIITCNERASMLVGSGNWVLADQKTFDKVIAKAEKKIGRETTV